MTAQSFAIVGTPLYRNEDHRRHVIGHYWRFSSVQSTQVVQRGSYSISSKVTKLQLAEADTLKPLNVVVKG